MRWESEIKSAKNTYIYKCLWLSWSAMSDTIPTLKKCKRIKWAEMHCNHIISVVGPARGLVYQFNILTEGTVLICLQTTNLNIAILDKAQMM